MYRHIRNPVVLIMLVVVFGVVGYTVVEAATTRLDGGGSCSTYVTGISGPISTGEPYPYNLRVVTDHVVVCSKTIERLQVNAVAWSPAWGGETGTYSGNVCYNTSQCTKTISTYLMPGEFTARTGGRAGTESDPGKYGHFIEEVRCLFRNENGVGSC